MEDRTCYGLVVHKVHRHDRCQNLAEWNVEELDLWSF